MHLFSPNPFIETGVTVFDGGVLGSPSPDEGSPLDETGGELCVEHHHGRWYIQTMAICNHQGIP